MSIDYCVAVECATKRKIGHGDAGAGMMELLDKLKARGRAASLREAAREMGKNPNHMKVRLQATDRDGHPVSREVTLEELEYEARPLEEYAAACADCPGGFSGEPFGCFRVIHYPISVVAEHWLLGRLQPYGTIGAQLCLAYLKEFDVQGDYLRRMRAAGFFEGQSGERLVLKKGVFRSITITADQLLETILLVGDKVSPDHCFGVLLWLGAIRLDGELPDGAEDGPMVAALAALQSAEEKRRRTTLELGPTAPPEAEPFRRLLEAMYASWLNEVPLFVSA